MGQRSARSRAAEGGRRLVDGTDAFLVINDTAMPKKDRHSAGVAPQFVSSLGKNANRQTLVSVTMASREVSVMVGLRLFLPESWTSDPDRVAKSKVPDDRQVVVTKPEIAIEEIDRIRAAGVRFGCVLADAGNGVSAPCRQALSERGLSWAVGIPYRQKVNAADVAMIFPASGHGRPRQHHITDSTSVAAEKVLADQLWKQVTWRRCTKCRLPRVLPLFVSVWQTVGPSASDMGAQHLPGKEVWLVGEHRSTGERSTPARTYQPIRRSGCWRAPSRRGGSASRPTSSSRKDSASTTSNADPG
jgi:SRSO17 transposase